MSDAIIHRGPDQDGRYVSGPVGFGFRRLSILDLSAHGNQPMQSADGQVVIVYNGEIYNYVELRQELRQLGHRFESTGDTEVLLHAYQEWGVDCLNKLNGMWAFLIFDRARNKIFGARDRFGIKPLFFCKQPDRILFASEIKSIRASGYYDARPNWRLSGRYLLEDHLSVPDENDQTLYEGICQLPAASAFYCDTDGNIKKWKYWELQKTEERQALGDFGDEFASLFEDSVRLRMRSDVPVGVCLSGGMDSTSIICAMARQLDENPGNAERSLKAFSFMTKEFDESEQIMATVEQTRAELHKLSMSPVDYWDRLADVARYQDEPVHSMNVVISFELYRMAAKNGVKVILNGQGADETLAGYPSYFPDYWYSLLRRGMIKDCWREIASYCDVQGGQPTALFANQVKRGLQLQISRLSGYRRLSLRRRQARLGRNRWISPDLMQKLDLECPDFEDLTLTNQLLSSVESDPLPLFLRVEDRNSMAHSVETRLPFLDYRLVEFAFKLEDNLKLRGHWNKYVLRESMKNRIPDTVREKPTKLGFPVPQGKWLAGPLSHQVRDLLSSRQARERGIYDTDAIKDDMSAFSEGKIDISAELFRVVQFEMFCQMIESGDESISSS